jgi:calcium-dependent protein kinase
MNFNNYLKEEGLVNVELHENSPSKSGLLDRFTFEMNHKIVYDDIRKYYNIGKKIGYGKYGVVRLVSKKSYEEKRFALKSIPRECLSADITMLEREFEILKTIDHPNIINFYEIYADRTHFHLVTEFCGGGELFERIMSHNQLCETYASKVIRQVL